MPQRWGRISTGGWWISVNLGLPHRYDAWWCRECDGHEWSIYKYITVGVGVCVAPIYIGICRHDHTDGWGVYVWRIEGYTWFDISHVSMGRVWCRACDGGRWDTYIYITMGVRKDLTTLYRHMCYDVSLEWGMCSVIKHILRNLVSAWGNGYISVG